MTESAGTVAQKLRATDYASGLRLWMLLLNFLPLCHAIGIAAIFVQPWRASLRVAIGIACLYLGPPILARLISGIVTIHEGRIPINHLSFLGWWASAQCQMIFNRFPFLEEALRVFPGLYSTWLRLWGSRIGRLTFWAPGVAVLDRGYLDIGDDVVFGAGVRLNGHVLMRNPEGSLELALGTIRIGSGASIGGYSLLTAGTEVAPGESTRAHLLSPPFTMWRDGKRVRGGIYADSDSL